MRKELCRNFQKGSCRYGEACRYLHPAQAKPNNPFGFGSQSSNQQQPQQQQQQQQKSSNNPFGFGVQGGGGNRSNQFQPFDNKWTRTASTAAGGGGGASTQQTSKQPADHKCTDPAACTRIMQEDFKTERPMWKLTCYGHWKNYPCDISGDISYEELRAMAYEEAKRGIPLQSIDPIEAVEKILRYSFVDKSLVKEAVTFGERLEFLGDAVLGLAFTNYILQTNPDINPKDLRLLHDLNVCNDKLARVAIKHGFHHIRTTENPITIQKIRDFSEEVSKAKEDDDIIRYGRSPKVPKCMADLVEAVAGAVYIDVDFDIQRVWEIFKGLVEPIFTMDDWRKHREPAVKLKALCHKHGKRLEYRRIGTTAQVYIDDQFVASGCSPCLYEAELAAAKEALHKWSECMTIEKIVDDDTLHVDPEDAKGKSVDICSIEKLPIQTSLPTASENPLTEMVIDEGAKRKLFEICSFGELELQTRSPSLPSASQNPLTYEMTEQKMVIDEDILELELEYAERLLRKICAKKHWPDPIFSFDEDELNHEKRYVCSVKIEIPTIQGRFHMRGDEKSKKRQAQNSAAYHMISALKSCLMSLVLRNLPKPETLKEKTNTQSQEEKANTQSEEEERMKKKRKFF